MSSPQPYVSIGLPVFNGENYLDGAIQSILSQSFTDFELIISDNSSTDRTQAICTAYASQDARIRYYRNERNVGAGPNFNQTVALARGRYFKWAAHDDLLMPDYLEKCVRVLEQEPTVVLCHSFTKEISATGLLITNHSQELPHGDSPLVQARFADAILIQHPCYHVFGLMRIEVLRRTRMIASFIGSDRVLLAELILHGRFYQVPEFLFISRSHLQQSILAIPLHRRGHWFDTAQQNGRAFPRWRYWVEYYRCIQRTPLDATAKSACYRQLLWYPSGAAVLMVKDLITAINPDYVESLRQRNPGWLVKLRQAEKAINEFIHQASQKERFF